MALRAGNYRGRVASYVHEIGDSTMGFGNVAAGAYDQGHWPPRAIMFGRTKTIYSLRSRIQHDQRVAEKAARIQAFGQFQETTRAPKAGAALAGIGLGALCGALLASALL